MTKKRSKNLVVPILLGSTVLSLGIVSYLARPRPVPIGINEVTTIPSCTNYVSGPILSKNTLNPGEKFTYTCAFTQSDLNCNFGAISEKFNFNAGKFIAWADSAHTIGSFEALAPNIPGTYIAYCQIGNTPACVEKGVATCNAKDKPISYTVIGDPIPKATGLKYECLSNGSRVKLTWDAVAGNPGFLPRLNNTNNDIAGQNWSVDNTDYMTDNHLSNTLEKDIAPNAKYNFWIHVKGPNNGMSEAANITFSCSNLTCKDGFNDSFDSANSRLTGSDSSYQTISNGQANFTKIGGRLRTTEYNGDIVSIIDISSSTSDTANPVIVARNYDDSRSRGVKIQYNKATGKVESGRITKPDGVTDIFDQWTSVNSSTKPVSYKIERKGTNFYAYFKGLGSDWKQIGSYENLTSDPISIRFGSDNDEKTSFDNLSITCPTPNKPSSPSNPKVTCSHDGTSVKFSWDSVSEVESYKIRLDDKAGKVVSFDDIKDLQKVVSITPGKTYSWWMHSHKGGYDSNQTSTVDFTCNNTVSPTPKPTVKPTTKPVVTKGDEVYVADNTPTPTPRASIKASPKASLSTTPVPSSLVNDTPTTPVSTNPFARFFRWLAGLFE